jgi:hypothetical protein
MIRRLFAVGIVPSITKVSAEQYFLAVLSYGVVQLAMIVEMVADIFGLKPDLTIGTLDGDHIRIYNVVNHELSHASHFSKVGSGYWSGYISHIANSFLRYGEDYTYGYANTSSYAGICQVGEMWGNAMGNIEMSEKYNNARLSDSYNDLFYRRPYRFFGDGGLDSLTTDDWIHPDPIWALITQKVLTKRQVFGCLTEDVDTVDKLEERMLTSYRDKAQLIEMAFDVNNVVKIPDITGPDNPIMDNVVYSIPANFPTGLTFNGWTVSPEKISGVDYQVFGGFNNRELIIKFITIGEYTITANFIVGGLPYTATKAIDLNFSYANQIVTGNITVPHAYGITVNNVTVQSGASLTLQAPSIVITEPFTVEAGATLVLAN